MSKPKVYLAGPIANVSTEEAFTWRSHAYAELRANGITAISPLRGEEWGGNSTLAKNLFDVRKCDAVLAYLPEGVETPGTYIEIGAAAILGKPIVVVTSTYHPCVWASASVVLHALEEAYKYLGDFFQPYTK